MGSKNVLLALLAMLLFLSKDSFSHKILKYIEENNLQRVERILKRDNSLVNRGFPRYELFCSLLEVAAEMGYVKMTRLLLFYGADPNLKLRGRSCFPLRRAGCYFARTDDEVKQAEYEKVINALLEYGENPNGKDNDGRTQFFWSAWGAWSKVSSLLLKHGADPCIKNNLGTSPKVFAHSEDSQISKDLLASSTKKQASLQELLKKQEVDFEKIDACIMDKDTPVCAKMEALTFLLKNRERFSQDVTDYEVKIYFQQIPFAYSFFSNDFLFGFALENRCLQLVDVRGQMVQEALEKCMICDVISTMFSRFGVFYRNRRLKELLKIDEKPGKIACFFKSIVKAVKKIFRKKKNHTLIQKKEDRLSLEKSLVTMVKKAKSVGRRDFVKKFYSTYEICRNLSTKLPSEIVGCIIGFTG